MVTVDIDHPDIEEYIDWKVLEEQKVAALVAGSKLAQKHMSEVMRACVEASDLDEAVRYNPRENKRAKKGYSGSPQGDDPGKLCPARYPVCPAGFH